MKFNIILLFCLCFTSGLLTASSLDNNAVDAQELLVSNADVAAEAFPLAFDDLTVAIIDDEVCYSATISVSIGGVLTGGVEVSGCGATAAAAWSAFTSAFRLAKEQ
jgi:hypothetical protein